MSKKSMRRREERRRVRWESFQQRLLRVIDEELPFGQMADMVSMEVMQRRPTREDAKALAAEIWRMKRRIEELPEVHEAVDIIVRLKSELCMLEYALVETVEAQEAAGW